VGDEKKMKKLATLLTLASLCGTALATEFDLANDFSTSNNPSATWTYGWFGNTLPGGSTLFLLDWDGNGWSETNGVSIWKNETGSAIGNVAPGQVALDTLFDEPVVIRWTAPVDIGLATIQIDGEFFSGVTGLEIRRDAGIVLSVTNTATFNLEMMVEPGDTIDFVGVGGGTKPLDLTITTIKEHLALTTLDDFDRYTAGAAWTLIPAQGWCTQRSEGSPANNYWLVPSNDYGWGKGVYRPLPFQITINSSLISIRHFSKIGPGGTFGQPALQLSESSITTTNTAVISWGQRAYSGDVSPPHIFFYDAEKTRYSSFSDWDIDEKLEFRADIDLSYEDPEGKFGLFSLFMKREGAIQWRSVDGLINIEMKVSDPATTITHLGATLNTSPNNGYLPHIDDIRYCTGENYNLGANENLLIGPNFTYLTTAWRTDGLAQSRISGDLESTSGPLHNGQYIYTTSSYTAEVYQVVNLLNQGFAAEDIDAGLYRAAFGGWLYAGSASFGQIEIEFLDINNQRISTNSLTVPTPSEWVELMSTNSIPAQTRSIRYSADLSSYARLDDAHLSVLGIPQEDQALTVSSIHGSPVPSIGTHSNSWGTIVNCSVAHVNAGTTQYECIGWTGTGSVPASGTSNAVEITLTDDSSIVWNWATNCLLEVAISGNGIVDADAGFYAQGSEQILSATPDSGWLFVGWSGDASGTNDAFVMMTEPQSVTATFSDDADGDGLLNSNETAIGSNPWKSDTDDDGFPDLFEVNNGLSPTYDHTAAVDFIRNNGGDFNLYPSNVVLDVALGEILMDVVGAEASLNLQLETSEDLQSWSNAGPATVWSWTVEDEQQFFRVRSGQ